MDTTLLLRAQYLDIIFEGRNKTYGGYELRSTYPDRMKKAGIYIFSFALLFAAYSLWINRAKPLRAMPLATKVGVVDIVNVELDLPKEPLEPPAAPKKLELKTELFIPPDIVHDEQVQAKETLATQDQLKEAVASNVTMSGPNIGDESFDMINSKVGGKDGGHELIETNHKSAKIEGFVEQMPEFMGGANALNEYMLRMLQYPTSALNANQQGKVLVRFVVNEDGSISNAEAIRGFGYGSEAEALRVVNAMPKWKPGRNNGRAVKVWFQIPVFFKLN